MMSYINLALYLCSVIASAVAFAQVPVIKIDGSSTVFPITEAVAEEFQNSQAGKVRVTVGISGTGGGFKKFCRGEIDIQDASRPISADEMKICKDAGITYIELPIAFDALTVVVNPKNTWVKDITVEELKKLWAPGAQGKITKWSQVRSGWPDSEIKLFGAGSDSGTFDYFTEAIVGKAKSSRGDYTASEDDNTLVQGVSANKDALGYLPYAYYEPNQSKLKVIGIIGGEKAPTKTAVLPSSKTVEDGSYFPLSRPIFIYISINALKKNEVKQFTNFYLETVSDIAKQVKYIALPAQAYSLAKENVSKLKAGTVFGGHSEIGLRVEELLKRETKH